MKAMTLRLPEELAADLRAWGVDHHRSLHSQILSILEDWVLIMKVPRVFTYTPPPSIIDPVSFTERVEDMKDRAHLVVTGSGPPRELLNGVVKVSPTFDPTVRRK